PGVCRPRDCRRDALPRLAAAEANTASQAHLHLPGLQMHHPARATDPQEVRLPRLLPRAQSRPVRRALPATPDRGIKKRTESWSPSAQCFVLKKTYFALFASRSARRFFHSSRRFSVTSFSFVCC